MDEVVTKPEHAEYVKRVDEHLERVDDRLDSLEEAAKNTQDLTISVKELAVTMNSMLAEQKKQGEKIDKLESKDGEKWDKAIWCVITALVGLFLGYIFNTIIN